MHLATDQQAAYHATGDVCQSSGRRMPQQLQVIEEQVNAMRSAAPLSNSLTYLATRRAMLSHRATLKKADSPAKLWAIA
jgi:hypothetical protein